MTKVFRGGLERLPHDPLQRDRLRAASCRHQASLTTGSWVNKGGRMALPALQSPPFLLCPEQQWEGDLTASARGAEALSKWSRSCQEQVRSQKSQGAEKTAMASPRLSTVLSGSLRPILLSFKAQANSIQPEHLLMHLMLCAGCMRPHTKSHQDYYLESSSIANKEM